jgi:hypothetical protein
MRPSDRFRYSFVLDDPEFCAWSFVILNLWADDPYLHAEFETVIDFFDFGFDVSKSLILSAEQGDKHA